MTKSLPRLLLLACLAAGPALAEVPAGHVYVGGGAILMAGLQHGSLFGGSLEVQFEWDRFLAGASVGTAVAGPEAVAFWAVGRLGYVFTDDPVWAPYVALGYGRFEDDRSFVPEVGVILVRGNRLGRFTASVQGFFRKAPQLMPGQPLQDGQGDFLGLTVRGML